MKLSNLYLAAADKLRTKGMLPDSRGATLTMCSFELGFNAPTAEREILEKFLTNVEKRINKLERPVYKLPLALKLAAERAAKFQPEFISLGGRNYVDHL